MAQRRLFVATTPYLQSRNLPTWSAEFHADVRAAEHMLTTLPLGQVNDLPWYPNSGEFCLRYGCAVMLFQKRSGRIVAVNVIANALSPRFNEAFAAPM